jgi:hypothetical protein
MYDNLPAPIALGMLGALAGLFAGAFNQCFPVWVGTAVGCSVGCACSLALALRPEIPAARPVAPDPIIVQNIYIMYEMSGRAKQDLPVATIDNIKETPVTV